jgi:hypothetical protein
MNEFKFIVEVTVKSTMGISFDKAMEGILMMEVNANQKGDPRFHVQILECPEENYYAESEEM